jgi:superfamily II DNA helicase RecQ
MTLDHPEFSKLIRSSSFMKNVMLIAIDEPHRVSQWGDSFRKRFADLDQLRSFASCQAPFLGVTATAPPPVLQEIRSRLLFSHDTTLFINRGNDRPNITVAMCTMLGAAGDLAVLDFVLAEALAGDPLKRTIIFFNTRELCLQGFKHLFFQLSYPSREEIDYLHALRTDNAKRHVLNNFQAGKIKILCATEAAGMVRRPLSFLYEISSRAWISPTSSALYNSCFRHPSRFSRNALDVLDGLDNLRLLFS